MAVLNGDNGCGLIPQALNPARWVLTALQAFTWMSVRGSTGGWGLASLWASPARWDAAVSIASSCTQQRAEE